jgi:hypothetical protein
MRMPGFTAERSLYPPNLISHGAFAGASGVASKSAVYPQLWAEGVMCCHCTFGDGGIVCTDCHPCDTPDAGS